MARVQLCQPRVHLHEPTAKPGILGELCRQTGELIADGGAAAHVQERGDVALTEPGIRGEATRGYSITQAPDVNL